MAGSSSCSSDGIGPDIFYEKGWVLAYARPGIQGDGWKVCCVEAAKNYERLDYWSIRLWNLTPCCSVYGTAEV